MTDAAPPYVELHARSAFSFLRGASSPDALVATAAELGLPAIALCDRDGLYGAPRLYGAAREHGLRALVGCELTMADGSVVPLLVASRAGYRNLCRLLSTARLEARAPGAVADDAGGDPRERKRPCYATWDELAAHAGGLVALTGDEEGPVRRAWRRGGPDAARAALDRLAGIFGPDRLHVELQRHRVRGEDREEAMLVALAEERCLPLLATGGVAYATREGRAVADVFTCLRHHTTLDAAGRLLAPNAERHLRSAAGMAELFADRPEAVAASARLAAGLDFTLRDLGYEFPRFAVPPGETQESWLRAVTAAEARERLGPLTPALRAQLDHELATIARLGFSGYFLVVWDICRWARGQGILVQGRGSAANSAVCFALGITAVDPRRHRLLFERFLSEGRVGVDGRPSWPDIDLDLPSGERRERVIQEVYRRHAPRGAAMTANVITYRGRSAAREVGRALGLPDDVLDRFSRLYAGGDFPHTLGLEDQLRLSGLPGDHPRLRALAVLHGRVRGLPRHLGQHSGGMIVGAGGLDEVVPLEPAAMAGRVVAQWDKDDCEDLGIVKIDFLGLGMMAVLQETFALAARRGRPVDLAGIPPDDPETFARIRQADTVGVFQIESRAQMSTLPRFQPRHFYDLAIEVAIVRPGPIVGRLVHPILRRRAGRERVTYLDDSLEPLLRPVLERTYGVVLFQEQLLEVAMQLAGFTATEAEELRRSMGFKRDPARLARVLRRLREALHARGHTPAVAEKVVEAASSFALYGFPESHAISFALLAYASAWLKVHRAPEFLASLLNCQPLGFYSPATLVQDARRHGVAVRPVCVAASDWDCTVEDDAAVRLGLRQARGLREEAGRALLAERARRPFASLDDFLARVPLQADERRALAALGALNVLAGHRRRALWQVEAAWETGDTLWRHAAAAGHAAPAGEPADPLAPMTPAERVQADFAGQGLTTGVHPMALVRDRLPPGVLRAADLPLARDGARVSIAGAVICRQRPGTARGVVFVSLEDETGVANAIVRPELFEQRRLVVNEEPALVIGGRLQHRDGVIHVLAERIEPLATGVPAGASHDFH